MSAEGPHTCFLWLVLGRYRGCFTLLVAGGGRESQGWKEPENLAFAHWALLVGSALDPHHFRLHGVVLHFLLSETNTTSSSSPWINGFLAPGRKSWLA